MRLLLTNALAGAGVALIVVAGLVGLDVGRIGTLIAGADVPAVPLLMITAAFVATFVAGAVATAIMRIGSDDERAGGRPIPIRVRARQ
jgi:hypothetical protein